MYSVATAKFLKRPGLRGLAFILSLLANMALSNSALADDSQFSGQIRHLWASTENNVYDPVSKVNQLLPGLIPQHNNDASVEAEFHASTRGVTAIATLQGQAVDQGRTNATGWLNELYTGWGKDEWQFSIGKKLLVGMLPMDFVPTT